MTMPPTAATDSTLLSAITGLFNRYGLVALNALIVVSTISGQSLVKRLTFTCPCAYPLNILQSSIFIFGPCVALFLFAVLVNPTTWRLVHGCCFRVSSARHPLSTALLYWIYILGQALIAPIVWLFVCLLDGDYYSCLRAAEFCTNSDRCPTRSGNPNIPEVSFKVCGACVCALDTAVVSALQSQSQVLAWSLLICAGILALIATCMIRMCDRYTYVQRQYVKIYRETEQRIFEEMAKEMASSVATDNSRAFFTKPNLLKEDWDALSSLPSLEDPFMYPRHWLLRNRRMELLGDHNAGNGNLDNYTTLQRWRKTKVADWSPNGTNVQQDVIQLAYQPQDQPRQ